MSLLPAITPFFAACEPAATSVMMVHLPAASANVIPREPGPKVNVRRGFWFTASDRGAGEATGAATGAAPGTTSSSIGRVPAAAYELLSAESLSMSADGAGGADSVSWSADVSADASPLCEGVLTSPRSTGVTAASSCVSKSGLDGGCAEERRSTASTPAVVPLDAGVAMSPETARRAASSLARSL